MRLLKKVNLAMRGFYHTLKHLIKITAFKLINYIIYQWCYNWPILVLPWNKYSKKCEGIMTEFSFHKNISWRRKCIKTMFICTYVFEVCSIWIKFYVSVTMKLPQSFRKNNFLWNTLWKANEKQNKWSKVNFLSFTLNGYWAFLVRKNEVADEMYQGWELFQTVPD